MGGGASKPSSSMATFLADVNAKSIEGMDPVTLTNTFAKYSEAVNRAKAVEKSLTGNTSLKAQSRLREARDLIASLDPWVSVMAHRIEKVEQQRIDDEKSAREEREKIASERRKGADEAAELARVNENLRSRGLPEIASLKQVNPIEASGRQDKTFDFKREQAESRAATKDAQLKMIRRWQVEDRDVREGRMAAKDASARAQFDVSESGRAVARAETHMNNLQDAFRMNKATKEELAQAADDLSEAKQMYEEAQARLKSLGVVAPVAGSPAPTPTSKGTADLVDEVFK